MSIEVCTKCCRYVDLDLHSDEGGYIDGKWICLDCQGLEETK